MCTMEIACELLFGRAIGTFSCNHNVKMFLFLHILVDS